MRGQVLERIVIDHLPLEGNACMIVSVVSYHYQLPPNLCFPPGR